MTLECTAAPLETVGLGRTGPIVAGLPSSPCWPSPGPAFVVAGANPLDAYVAYFVAPLTREFTLWEVLNVSTPAALRGRRRGHRVPSGLLEHRRGGPAAHGGRGRGGHRAGRARLAVRRSCCPSMVAAGALAGAAWALVPALLRVRLGIDEVVTTLLLNPVALLAREGPSPWAMDATRRRASRNRLASRSQPSSPGCHVPALPGPVATAPRLHRRHRRHRRGLVGAEPDGHRPAPAGRGAVSPRRALRGHQGGADAAARGPGQRRHRRRGGRQRGGGHPVPPDLRHLAGLRLHGHRGGHAGRPDHARRAAGRPPPGRPLRGRLIGRAQPADPSQLGAVVEGTLLLVVIGALALRRHRSRQQDERPADEGEPPSAEPTSSASAEGPPA